MHHQRFAHLGPMVNTGSRAARAFCQDHANLLPPQTLHRGFRCRHQIASLQTICPETMRAPRGNSGNRQAGHGLPEPDSPTSPAFPQPAPGSSRMTALTRHAG